MTSLFALDRRPQTTSEKECLDRHWSGVPEHRIVLAREGVNTVCVGCGAEPMAGGLRCVACYCMVAKPKSVRYAERGAA